MLKVCLMNLLKYPIHHKYILLTTDMISIIPLKTQSITSEAHHMPGEAEAYFAKRPKVTVEQPAK